MLHLVLEKSKMQAIEKVFFEASSFTPKTKKDAIDQLLPDQLKIVKPPLWVNIFLIASFVLGALVTLSTFIWGLF